jgi:hypothetical protein
MRLTSADKTSMNSTNERTARSIALIHAGVWLIGGTGLGIALGTGGSVLYAMTGGIIGWFVGQMRATAFRLQARTIDISQGLHNRRPPDANL